MVESTGPIVVSDCLRLKFDVHESLVGTFTDSNFNEVGVGVLSMRLRNDERRVLVMQLLKLHKMMLAGSQSF